MIHEEQPPHKPQLSHLVPLETALRWPLPDSGPAHPCCTCVTCPYRERFLRAMTLLRDLAALVDSAHSTAIPSSPQGA